MISQNDLYDITFALVAIRNDIQYRFNSEILSKIIQVLRYTQKEFEDNQVRKALADVQGLDQERWYYIYHNNVYVNHRFLTNKYAYEILIKLCEESINILKTKNFERVYDLIDCYHCLPDIMADHHFCIPKNYWKTYIKPYRDKWDKSFLVVEQKIINGTETNYLFDGGSIIREQTGSKTMWFYYDGSGSLTALDYNGTRYYYYYNACGDVIGLYDANLNSVVTYTYDSWGKLLNIGGSLATTLGTDNPFRYRGYYYDTETGLYYVSSRYYDPEIGRWINADSQLNDDVLGNNLFTYCGNNPIIRVDSGGKGWWIVAGAIIGGLAGGITKALSNVCTGKRWNDGIIGAVVGGAVYGGILAATGNIIAAGFASAAAESLTNQVVSYTPKVSQVNGNKKTKKVTSKNVIDSAKTVLNETAVNGTISAVTGKVASKIVPTNNGWFKPQKIKSSFVGKYAIKSEVQTLTQSGLLFGVEGIKHSLNNQFNKGQQPTVEFYPDTEIRAVE